VLLPHAGPADAAARAPQNQLKYVVDEVAGMERRRIRLRSGRTLNADILVVACACATCRKVRGMGLLHACTPTLELCIRAVSLQQGLCLMFFTHSEAIVQQCRGGHTHASPCMAEGRFQCIMR